jgi:hypothetical protein
MPLVAGDDVIGLRRFRALQKLGVARVGRDGRRNLRQEELALIAEHGGDLVRWKRKFRSRQHGCVFLEDLLRETGVHQALMDGEQDQRLVAGGREKAGD